MEQPSPAHPVRFGRYLITEFLGRGGMAEVYKGKLTGLDGFERDVCIKRILPDLSARKDLVRLLFDEAKITVALHHPNIVQCLDLGKEDGVYFMTMEYIPGRDLDHVFSTCHKMRARIPFKHALHIVMETLKGLAYAQRARGPDGRPLNLVHRDLTPSNIFMSVDGDVKIGDFGVARASVMKRMETQGMLVGKIGYMSPEQVRGEAIDGRTDIWALGVAMFELITMQRLFDGNDLHEVFNRIARFDPAALLGRFEALPPDMEDILRRCLAPDPRDRYEDAQAFLDDVTDFVFNEGIKVNSRDLAQFMEALYPEGVVPPSRFTDQDASPPGPAPAAPVDAMNTQALIDYAAQVAPDTRAHGRSPGRGAATMAPGDIRQQATLAPPAQPSQQATLVTSAADDWGDWEANEEASYQDTPAPPASIAQAAEGDWNDWEAAEETSEHFTPVPPPPPGGQVDDWGAWDNGDFDAAGPADASRHEQPTPRVDAPAFSFLDEADEYGGGETLAPAGFQDLGQAPEEDDATPEWDQAEAGRTLAPPAQAPRGGPVRQSWNPQAAERTLAPAGLSQRRGPHGPDAELDSLIAQADALNIGSNTIIPGAAQRQPVSNLGEWISLHFGPDTPVAMLKDGHVLAGVPAHHFAKHPEIGIPDRVRIADERWAAPEQLPKMDPAALGQHTPKKAKPFFQGTLCGHLGAAARSLKSRRIAVVAGDRAWIMLVSAGELFGVDDGARDPCSFTRHLLNHGAISQAGSQRLPKNADDMSTLVAAVSDGLCDANIIKPLYNAYLFEQMTRLLRAPQGELLGYEMRPPDHRTMPSVPLGMVLVEAARHAFNLVDFRRMFADLPARFKHGIGMNEVARRHLRPQEVELIGQLRLPSAYALLARDLDDSAELQLARSLNLGLVTGLIGLESA